jgi:hypothetical protein
VESKGGAGRRRRQCGRFRGQITNGGPIKLGGVARHGIGVHSGSSGGGRTQVVHASNDSSPSRRYHHHSAHGVFPLRRTVQPRAGPSPSATRTSPLSLSLLPQLRCTTSPKCHRPISSGNRIDGRLCAECQGTASCCLRASEWRAARISRALHSSAEHWEHHDCKIRTAFLIARPLRIQTPPLPLPPAVLLHIWDTSLYKSTIYHVGGGLYYRGIISVLMFYHRHCTN